MHMSRLVTSSSAHIAAIRLKSANKYIFRALLSMASAALLTRMMGMLNQVIVTSRFGAGATMDAYFIATTFPTLLAYLLISSIETAVIPVYARVRAQEGKEQASILFSTLLNLLLVGATLLTLVLFVFRRQVVLFSAPALDPFRLGLAINLAPFTYPVIIPMIVIGFLECILNTEGQFGWPAYAGLLVPLTTGVLVLVSGSAHGVMVFCIGTIIGLCLQLCTFLIRVRNARIVYRPVLALRSPALAQILLAAWPVLLGSLISQASPLIDQIFASFLSVGSISALSYSLKLVSVCSGVIFASVGRAALPYLSRQAAGNDMPAFKGTLRLYLWVVGLSTTALSVILLFLAHPLVQLLFQRGAFSAEDTNLTATTFVGFIFGLAPMSLGIITSKAFSAIGKTKVLMGVSIFSVIANAIFDAIFAHFWQSQGIALATSAYYVGTMLIMFVVLRRLIGKLDLFVIPPEIKSAFRNLSLKRYFTKWDSWQENFFSPFGSSYQTSRLLMCVGIACVVFTIGAIGLLHDSSYTLRLALGSIAMVTLLRYRYALVIVWVLVSAVLSPNIPFLTNNNFFTGLTIPTLLLLIDVPVRSALKTMPVLTFLLIYLLWVFAGIGISIVGMGVFLTTWFTYLNYLAVAIITISVLTTRLRLFKLIDTILLGATFVALYGIYGYITQQNGVMDPTTSLFRIFSIFSAAPTLALFLSVVLPIAIYRATTLRGWGRLVVSLLVILFLVVIGLTFTRSAFISVPLSVIVMLLFLPSRKVKYGLFCGIAGLAILLFLLVQVGNVPLFNRFLNQDIGSLNGRTYLWQALLNHFDPAQLLGYGLKSSDILLANLQVGFAGNVIATSASNLFIGTLYDHGVIGITLLLLIFISLAISLLIGIRRTTGERRALFVVAFAILVDVFLQSFDMNDLWTQAIGLYFWIIMALPFISYWSTTEQAIQESVDVFVGIPRKKAQQVERESVPLA